MTSEIKMELGRRGVRWDIADRLCKVLDSDDPRVARVFCLRMNGKTQSEISDVTGIPQRTVSWIISQKRKKVCEILLKRDAQGYYRSIEGPA